MINSCIV